MECLRKPKDEAQSANRFLNRPAQLGSSGNRYRQAVLFGHGAQPRRQRLFPCRLGDAETGKCFVLELLGGVLAEGLSQEQFANDFVNVDPSKSDSVHTNLLVWVSWICLFSFPQVCLAPLSGPLLTDAFGEGFRPPAPTVRGSLFLPVGCVLRLLRFWCSSLS